MSIEYTPGPLLDSGDNPSAARWNDSSDPAELTQSAPFDHSAPACNSTIARTIQHRRVATHQIIPREQIVVFL